MRGIMREGGGGEGGEEGEREGRRGRGERRDDPLHVFTTTANTLELL